MKNNPILKRVKNNNYTLKHIPQAEIIKPSRQKLFLEIDEYITEKRLKKAQRLLKNTDMTAAEISSASGFSDYNYFLKSFKKYFGVSAKEIRKKL